MNILFITWDGPQVSYLEGLFIPIFKTLKPAGIHVHVLQFTWGNPKKVERSRIACQDAGCGYEMVSVIRNPAALGSFLSAIIGHRRIRRIIKQHKIDVVMPRSTLPALSSLLALRGRKERLVFDADGLPLDERVEFSGLSNTSVIYRFLRDIEAQTVRRSDSVLTRSLKGSEILIARAGAGVNPNKFISFNNGRDTNLFSVKSDIHSNIVKNELGIMENSELVIYVGSVGGKYLLCDMLKLFFYIKDLSKDAHFLILTGDIESAKKEISVMQVETESITVMTVDPDNVSRYTAAADLGLSLIQPSYSMQAVSVLKIGEYLLSGVPVISTAGVGDSSETCSKAGFVIDNVDDFSLKQAAKWFVDNVIPNKHKYREMSRNSGLIYYSNDLVTAAYREAILGDS